MTYPLVRDLVAEAFPVPLPCGLPGFSRQAFYAWSKNPVSRRDLEDAHAVKALIDANGDDPAFGKRCLVDELERAGIEIGERWAWRTKLLSGPENGRTPRRHGTRSLSRLQHRHGIVLSTTATQCFQHWRVLVHTSGVALRDHLLDPTHLQSERTPTQTRPAHPNPVCVSRRNHRSSSRLSDTTRVHQSDSNPR